MFLICNFVVMGLILFFILLFIVLVGGGWSIGKAFGNALFPKEKEEKYTFIDKSVHHHYIKEDHQHIHIIDEETKKEVKHYHEINKLEK